jgi:hypothetical protein
MERAVLHDTVCGCKQSVVATATNVLSGMNASAALTNENGSSINRLAVEYLRTQSLSP